ncbi:MAG: COX15/CtaA family protein [Betaproteobacteria bacterium]|nr:COX15/CtaA family protein [Betaproteobacteria bacterium]MBU6511123.1 COX15/CtaA family protein [Betaproteobacteria bacterium]MDE1955159.1 COX15/CtaA family protein [Betaproteobacteria bacterium]MDE2150826.1 COX15/CtaA family protein [Betaproteobacteria bacterium]MDE2479138.1 COX15/CtaA family protein [Betaproteobacteria bacterium]
MMSPSLPSNLVHNMYQAVPTVWLFSLHWLQAGLWLLGLGLVIWAGMRMRWARLVALLVFLTLDLVMFGAFVRLTDAGLGCPDWPGCYGRLTPAQAHVQIHQAVQEEGGTQGNVSPFKAWVEMIHRYVATIIGALITVMAARALWARRKGQGMRVGLPLLLFAWIVVQGMFGAWTVTLLLKPLIVTLHLMGGIVLLLLAAWFWMRNRPEMQPLDAGAATRWLTRAALLALLVQIFLGGWVSTNYAAVACSGFPTCNGSWNPPADWSAGFTMWRDLGRMPDGSAVTLQALIAIHWAHRLFAVVATVLVLGAAGLLARLRELRRLAGWLVVALAAQIALGVSVVLLQHPLVPAVAHNGVAALMVLLLTTAAWRTSGGRRARQPAAPPAGMRGMQNPS